MTTIRKPRIGLVGMMAHPFRGDKESYFASDVQAMRDLAQALDFSLKIVPDGIYNFEDAQSAAVELSQWDADYILVQSSSFSGGDLIRPFAQLGTRLGLWAVPEGPPTSEGGLPLNSFTGLNMYNSILRRYLKTYPHPVKWFFGRPQDPLFKDRFTVTIAALRAVINLKGKTIGLIGGVAPGFDNLIVDPRDYETKLGLRVRSLELDVILSRARKMDRTDLVNEKAQSFLQNKVTINENLHAYLIELAKLQLAVETVIEDNGLDAIALSCWPRFQMEPGVAVCSLVGQLNSLGIITACEGDVPSAAAMLALYYLTKGEDVTLMDLVTVDPADDTILFWHCGPTPPKMAGKDGVKMESLWLFENDNTPRMGLHNDLVLKEGGVTVMGFTPNIDKMLVFSGNIDPNKASYKGSRGWLRNIQIKGSPVTVPDLVDTLMGCGYQHHYPLAYGKLTDSVFEMAAYLGVPPVSPQVYTNFLKE